MIKELEELKKFPHAHHDDGQDVLAQGGVFGADGIAISKNILTDAPHIETPSNPDIAGPSMYLVDNLSKRFKNDLDKGLTKFGEQNGFPVIFVISNKVFDPPQKDPVSGSLTISQTDVKMFKGKEMHEASAYARKVMGQLGIYNPNKLKSTPRSEHSIFNAIDEGDTLGITDHWVED